MADVTITVPDPQIPRLKTAMDEILSPALAATAVDPENPTNAEYLTVLQGYIVGHLKQLVRTAESQIARRTALPNDEIGIT